MKSISLTGGHRLTRTCSCKPLERLLAKAGKIMPKLWLQSSVHVFKQASYLGGAIIIPTSYKRNKGHRNKVVAILSVSSSPFRQRRTLSLMATSSKSVRQRKTLSLMATSSKSIPRLQDSAEDATLKALGKLSKDLSSRFCCGGKLQPAQSEVCLNYEVDNEIMKVVFPGADEAALARLVRASSVASFGKGNEQVIDPSYRDAYKIDPDKLTTSFCPCSTNILSEIETLMVPNRSIRAELHKLNLYTGPRGHFKSHVDTLRSGNMFGSLVICLPTQFSGGALVTRHGDQEVVFDWSSLPDYPMSEVCWAAFFSDVEHEILPVIAGHRLTLTYNLYAVQERLHSIPPGNPFYNCLQTAIGTPHFMRDGSCLAFCCEHLYAFSLLNEKELLPHVLKGVDYLIFSSAKLLDLRVTVKPVVEGTGYGYTTLLPYFPPETGTGGYENFDNSNYPHLPDASAFERLKWDTMLDSMRISSKDDPVLLAPGSVKICGVEPSWNSVFSLIKAPIKATPEMLEEADACIYDESSLKVAGVCEEDIPIILDAYDKLQRSHWQKNPTLGMYTYYGNEEVSEDNVYQSAFILIEVPPWGSSPRTLASDSESPGPEKKGKIERGYQRIFDDDNKNLYCWKCK